MLAYEELAEVTLVGWSYRGTIITGVADLVPERLAQLVYLDATVPADGECEYDAELVPEASRAGDRAAAEAVGLAGYVIFAPLVDGIRSMLPDPADQDWLLPKLVPQPLGSFTQPIRLGNPAAAAVARTYISCADGKDPATDAFFLRTQVRIRSEPGWRYVELAANHLAPVSAPRATAEALLSLVPPPKDR